MTDDKQSFFEKLTGTVTEDEQTIEPGQETEENPLPPESEETEHDPGSEHPAGKSSEWLSEVGSNEGQLTVDVFQTPTHIVVQAPMAGVKPDDVDVSINNDMITIRGKRDPKKDIDSNSYYYRELFWGPFSRSILMPDEVDSDRTEASFKNGLLTVKMAKVNKEGVRQVKIQAKEI